MSTVLEAEGVTFAYPHLDSPVVCDVSLAVGEGEVYAVIGPNGSGKSTLLKLLLGVLRPSAGRVTFAGRDVREWPRRELARRVGVVAQNEDFAFPITVHDLVAMGRYPYLGPWQSAGQRDREAIARALDRCQVADLAGRPVNRLSGGERQRARLARALAQEPSAFVLDEPTASLDIAHEMTIFELLAMLAATDGATVVVVTHHLNLAARYAHRMLLLDRGRVAAEGPPGEVLARASIERTYGWPVHVFSYAGPGRDAGAPQIVPLADGADPAKPCAHSTTGDRS